MKRKNGKKLAKRILKVIGKSKRSTGKKLARKIIKTIKK